MVFLRREDFTLMVTFTTKLAQAISLMKLTEIWRTMLTILSHSRKT